MQIGGACSKLRDHKCHNRYFMVHCVHTRIPSMKSFTPGGYMKKRSGLLTQFAIIFILFALVTTIATSVITYFVQMRTYRELCWDTIQQVDDYLTNLILADGDDFLYYTKFYQEHYEDFRIPIDFDGYEKARSQFVDAYTHAYPDQTLFSDISVSELPYVLQLLDYTYRHVYWLTTF